MFARKCDRCGKLYENYYDVGGNAVYAFTRNEGGDPLDKEVYVKDLCPACMEAYRQFMDGYEPIPMIEYEELQEIEAQKRLMEKIGDDEDLKLIARATGDDFPFIKADFDTRGYTTQEDGKKWTKEQLAEQIRKNTEEEEYD